MSRMYILSIAPVAIALNVAVGLVVNVLKLPVYLDAVGTLLAVLLFYPLGQTALWAGILIGSASFLLAGIIFNPVLLWFIPTQAVIALYGYVVLAPIVYRNQQTGYARMLLYVALVGVGLGFVCALTNAPIVAYVFGGITGAGPSLIAAAFLKMGQTVWQATMSFGLTSEPIDKALQCLIAFVVFDRLFKGGVKISPT